MLISMKKVLLTILAVGIFLYGVSGILKVFNYFGVFNKEMMGGTLTIVEKIDAKTAELFISEEAYKLENGKYKQELFTVDEITGQKYAVHEYVTPKGEVGYQITFYNSDGSIENKGYGPEAESRTYFLSTTTLNSI